jgi:mono/diheme cytochrome c family protein
MSGRRLRTLARGLLLCGIAGVASGCGTSRPSEYKIPSDAARQTNPFPVTPESIAKGKDLYVGGGCAICHGKDGDGKGVLAKDISMNLHNWRDPSVQGSFTDGELFYIMQNGKGTNRGRMPGYRDQETPEQIWETISFIRSLATTSK